MQPSLATPQRVGVSLRGTGRTLPLIVDGVKRHHHDCLLFLKMARQFGLTGFAYLHEELKKLVAEKTSFITSMLIDIAS
jgi:hypothetical protein